jgi:K319-like protein
LKLELLIVISFSIILLFTSCANPTHAQLTKTLGTKITLSAVNNTTIRQGQHIDDVYASSYSPLKNPLSALSINSSFSDKRQSLQTSQSLQPPPIGNAGSNQVVTSGSTVILNGSNSRAPNGIILSYSWKQIPTRSPSTLSGVNTPVWKFTAPNVTADTLLQFQLNVTDNLGQVGTAFVNVLDKPASTFIGPPSTQIIKSPFTAVHLLPKLKTGNNNNASNTLSSSLPSVHNKLHMVKITSPTKGEQIPVRSGLTVAGTSVANSTSAFCQVSVIVNGIKPYQKAIATGNGGANDYSTWDYRLIPTYTVIKQGQNKITAKFSCINNPSLTSYNSVNVTGVANSNPAIIAASSKHVNNPVNCRLFIYAPGPCA